MLWLKVMTSIFMIGVFITAIDQIQKNEIKKTPKEDDENISKNMSLLVFNPFIMVFLPLFDVIMLL